MSYRELKGHEIVRASDKWDVSDSHEPAEDWEECGNFEGMRAEEVCEQNGNANRFAVAREIRNQDLPKHPKLGAMRWSDNGEFSKYVLHGKFFEKICVGAQKTKDGVDSGVGSRPKYCTPMWETDLAGEPTPQCTYEPQSEGGTLDRKFDAVHFEVTIEPETVDFETPYLDPHVEHRIGMRSKLYEVEPGSFYTYPVTGIHKVQGTGISYAGLPLVDYQEQAADDIPDATHEEKRAKFAELWGFKS